MAKISYVDLTTIDPDQFYSNLTPQDRFQFSRLTYQHKNFGRRRKKGISQRSLMPQLSETWATFTQEQKDAWAVAATKTGLNGWRLFVQDQCLRIVNEMSGSATPVVLHQSYVGNLRIEAPAEEIKIAQFHPQFYWVLRKVAGFQKMYEPVKITENFYLPLTIGLNYKGDLTSTGAGSFAKFYARVRSLYQGRDIYTNQEIALDFSEDWQAAETTISSVIGEAIRYELYIHLYKLRGNLYIDNVRAEHSGQNWARDPYCRDINQNFTKAFYQVPKHWIAETLPAGADFESTYLDF